MVRCIALSGGTKAARHFYFADVDVPIYEERLQVLALGNPSTAIIKTKKGYHFISNMPISPDILLRSDPKCPNVAVRIYPARDYKLLYRSQDSLCHHVVGAYYFIFGMFISMYTKDCPYPPRLGVYERKEPL